MKKVFVLALLLAFVVLAPLAYGGQPGQQFETAVTASSQGDQRDDTRVNMNKYGYSGPYVYVHYRNLSDTELRQMEDLVQREGTNEQKVTFANEWQKRGLSRLADK